MYAAVTKKIDDGATDRVGAQAPRPRRRWFSRFRVWRELRNARLYADSLRRHGLLPKPAQQCARNGTEAVPGGDEAVMS